MRDALAERLLAKVMSWAPEDIARERPILQALALLKYDEYQQYSPGIRFVESLALWLEQLTPAERPVAYEYIRSRLIFLSEAEMAHFAAVMYPDFLRPMLLARAARVDGTSPLRVTKIAQSQTFLNLQSCTLIFGLSDGARIDQFRRSNRELSHEQIFANYDIPVERLQELPTWLEKHGFAGKPVPAIILLDDFAGSGASYLREADGILQGKLAKLIKRLTSTPEWRGLVSFPSTSLIVALYVATERAFAQLHSLAPRLQKEYGAELEVLAVQLLHDHISLKPTSAEPFVTLVETYYDPSLEDEHSAKGGTDLKYGFAGCGLPLVLHHNTPNNSLFLLWVENSPTVRPLFERFSRHRREA